MQASTTDPSAFARLWREDKYRLTSALRPFSLVVGVVSSSWGLALGWSLSESPWLPALLTLLASVLLQAGVNLINDHSDRWLIPQRYAHLPATAQQAMLGQVKRNFYTGLAVVGLGCLLGLWLIWLTGPLLWVFGLLGVLGVFAYAQPPIDCKRRGLGAPLVFLLMGLLMVQGGYYVMAQQLSLQVLWLSLPISLLVALLLLANELRDFELDRAEDQRTLTVRLGYLPVSRLYRLGLLITFALPLLYWTQGVMPLGWLTLLAWPLAWQPLRLLSAAPAARKQLTALTGRLMAGFGLLQLIAWCLGQGC